MPNDSGIMVRGTEPLAPEAPTPSPSKAAASMKEQLDTVQAMLAHLISQKVPEQLTGVEITLKGCKKDLGDLAALHNDHQTSLTKRLDDLPVQLRPVPLPRWRVLLPWGAGVVLGAALTAAGWLTLPGGRYQGFAGALDAIVAEAYPTLSKPVQEKLTAVYSHYRFQAPGARQKGAK